MSSDEESAGTGTGDADGGGEEASPTGEAEAIIFVKVLQNHNVLLAKSNTPDMKALKRTAAVKLCEDLKKNTGLIYDLKKTIKRIANMRSRVKAKSDKNKTGNKKINLLEWEKMFLKLCDAEGNPSFCKVPGGGLSLGLPATATSAAECETGNTSGNTNSVETPKKKKNLFIAASSQVNNLELTKPKELTQPKKRKLNGKTSETEQLSTVELQRLVLLEQLSYIRMRKRMLEQTKTSKHPMSVPSHLLNVGDETDSDESDISVLV